MRFLLFLCLCSTLLSCFDGADDALNALDAGHLSSEQVSIIFEKSKKYHNSTELSIALIHQDSVQFYGVRRVSDSLKTVDNKKTVFEIGSISKVFTGALLADAVVKGNLNLSDPLDIKNKWG